MTMFELALIGLGIIGLSIFTMAKLAERYERAHRKHKHA